MHNHIFFPVTAENLSNHMKYAERKESPPGLNFTMIPEDLLLHSDTVPIFTIRDPRLVVPSTLEVLQRMNLPHGGGRPNYFMVTCGIWNRMLYDYYVTHGIQPIVVDADDYMTSEDFVRELCTKIGLDPAQAYFSWCVTEGYKAFYASKLRH